VPRADAFGPPDFAICEAIAVVIGCGSKRQQHQPETFHGRIDTARVFRIMATALGLGAGAQSQPPRRLPALRIDPGQPLIRDTLGAPEGQAGSHDDPRSINSGFTCVSL
jgi:hypothetical protein